VTIACRRWAEKVNVSVRVPAASPRTAIASVGIRVIAFADKPDYAHLAESLGMPVGSIGPTRGRCLAKLRDLLAGDPHWEGQL